MEIDFESAKITVDIKVSKVGTGTSSTRDSAFLHSTRNADQIIAGDNTARDGDISAINIHASADVLLGPGDHLSPDDNISNLKFRFIQLALHLQGYARWAGYT